MNNYTASGRIISSREFQFDKNGQPSNGLSVKMSVSTGQRAKEGEYPPSFIIDFTLWDKLATAILPRVVKGNIAVVSGQLAVPTIYESGSNSGVNMSYHMVHDIQIITVPGNENIEEVADSETSSDDNERDSTVSKATSKSDKKRRAAAEDDDDIPF